MDEQSRTALLLCCVCGDEITDDEEAMYPVASDFTRVAHRDECAAPLLGPSWRGVLDGGILVSGTAQLFRENLASTTRRF